MGLQTELMFGGYDDRSGNDSSNLGYGSGGAIPPGPSSARWSM